jgi:hypothetical protein
LFSGNRAFLLEAFPNLKKEVAMAELYGGHVVAKYLHEVEEVGQP